jgi:serine/threonine-protein kinase
MALRKEPERRYASVAQFSADIERHLQGRPVLAHKDTLVYRATKFIKRNKIAASAALLVLLTLVAGIIATTRQAHIAAEQRDRARKEATKADRLNAFLQNILGFSDPTWFSANPERNREATIADALEQAGQRAESELADEPEVLAAVQFTIGSTYKSQAKYAAAEPYLRASVDLPTTVLGREHPDVAQSLIALGELHHYRGQFAEAEPLYREAGRDLPERETRGQNGRRDVVCYWAQRSRHGPDWTWEVPGGGTRLQGRLGDRPRVHRQSARTCRHHAQQLGPRPTRPGGSRRSDPIC